MKVLLKMQQHSYAHNEKSVMVSPYFKTCHLYYTSFSSVTPLFIPLYLLYRLYILN